MLLLGNLVMFILICFRILKIVNENTDFELCTRGLTFARVKSRALQIKKSGLKILISRNLDPVPVFEKSFCLCCGLCPIPLGASAFLLWFLILQ